MDGERQERGSLRGWFIIIAFSAILIGWGLLNYALIKDSPRAWNFGTLPDAPSQSIYSTEPTPAPAHTPRQTPQLPEAKPWKRPPPGSTYPTTPSEKDRP